MEINEKAKIAAIYQDISNTSISDPNKFVSRLAESAKSAVQVIGLDKSPSTVKTTRFDFGGLNERYAALSAQQLKIVESIQVLAKQLESSGYEKPNQDNWLSKTLKNYQRGYLENDIFTEAAGALVWMAAKAIEKVFFEKDTSKHHQAAASIQNDIAKMAKTINTELARTHVEHKGVERHGIMDKAVHQARELWKGGRQQEADNLILSTHGQLSQSARKQYSHYEPRPDHQKVVADAQARQKSRQKAESRVTEKQKNQTKEKGHGIGL